MLEELIITREKTITYLKKYWWILMICLILGGILLGMGIRSNMNSDKNIVSYEQKILPVKIDEENIQNIATSSIIGNCKTLLSIEDVQKEINDLLENEGEEIISNWNKILLEPIANSNFFILKIFNEKNLANTQMNAIISVLNEKMKNYRQETELIKIGGLERYVTQDENSPVLLKDVLIFFAVMLSGVFLVYVLMILDKHISSPEELRQALGKDEILQLSKKDSQLLKIWCTILNKKEKAILVLGNNIREIKIELEALNLDNLYITDFENYNKIVSKESTVKTYLIIKSMTTKKEELNVILQLNKLYDKQFNGWVYLKP